MTPRRSAFSPPETMAVYREGEALAAQLETVASADPGIFRVNCQGISVNDACLIDRYLRRISYLRISVTDRCNFRCVYCMPPEGLPLADSRRFLTPPEIARTVRVAASLGVRRVRLTGGEPLMRAEITDIVAMIAETGVLDDLALTTNGSRLSALAGPLKQAGLKRVNISLDSLNPKTFAKLAAAEKFGAVRAGIDAALSAGLKVKINTVVMQGINDHELPDFIAFAIANGIEEARFIEFMPLCGSGWSPEKVAVFTDIIPGLAERFGFTRTIQPPDDVAKTFLAHHNGKVGKVGFINTVSEPFCRNCSRLRLTADGEIRPCLFSTVGVSLQDALRSGSDLEIAEAFKVAVKMKPQGNDFARIKAVRGEKPVAPEFYRHGVESPSIRRIGG